MEPGALSNAAVVRSVQPSRHVNRGGLQARFFIESGDDPQAARQRPLARRAQGLALLPPVEQIG